MNPSAARIPVPESRSSGREYPVNPSIVPSSSRMLPITQFSSRGRRKAPVNATRIRWIIIAPTKIIAAQWCI